MPQARALSIAFVSLLSGACAGAMDRPAPSGLTVEPTVALNVLRSAEGPERFAMVTPRIYRGAEPTDEHLALLRALGVTRVIDLRRESLGSRRAERAMARELGLQYIEYPFYGVFGAEPRFLRDLLAELERDDGGAIYVHCDNGSDRTSLVVALYRVALEGWAPETAWNEEVLAYGHRPTRAKREIGLTFQDYVHEQGARRETASTGPAHRRRLAESTEPADNAGRSGIASP